MSLYAELSDFGVMAGLTDAQKTKFLTRASSVVDSASTARYLPPFTTWGEDMTTVVVHLARWYALAERGAIPPNSNDERLYIEAQVHLDKIATGKRSWIGAVDTSPTTYEGGAVTGATTTTVGSASVDARGWELPDGRVL
jgi:phage gp36-like protein